MSEDAIRAEVRRVLEGLGAGDAEIPLERPRDPEHGDLATNVAMTLASRLRRSPRQIAEELAAGVDRTAAGVSAVEVAGPGFLNFRLTSESFGDLLLDILQADQGWGRSATGGGEPIMVEWVSANPTGPLHPGHGRQVALGDAIARLLEWTGWKVHREFYYNDAGVQMEKLAQSVRARYLELLGAEGEVPDGGYHGEYVVDVARALVQEVGDRWLDDDSPGALDATRAFASRLLMDEIRRDLDDMRVHFDEYYRETSLYEEGRVDAVVDALREADLVYDRDGAVWLRTTRFGDQKDRVMIKSDGNPTYFLPDVAYHVSKWERGFRRVVNVQGADHHSTVDRVRAGLRGLGLPEGYPEYVLHQMVTFERSGDVVKLSKRAGASATLRELFEEVGVDVTRWFFQMRKPEAHLVFDLDAALDQSEKNPVYKIQYAHARMHQIFARAGVEPADVDGADVDLELLETAAERELVKQLAELPDRIEGAAGARAPHLLCDYLEQTAGAVNSWYHSGNPSRNPDLAVLVDDEGLRAARLALVRAVQIVLRNGLTVLGVTAPRRMEREPENPPAPAG